MKEAKSEAIEIFDSVQLGFGVSGGAEAIIYSAKITYEKIFNDDSKEGVFQDYFQNAFNSVKRSHLLQAACNFMPGIAAFTNFATLSIFHYYIITSDFKVNRVFNKEISLSTSLFVDVMACYRKKRETVPNFTQHDGTWTMVLLQTPQIKSELRSIS